MQRAERDLARARLAARDGDPATAPAFTAAIADLRQHSTQYHLAHGLLDHAEHLLRMEDHGAAGAAIGEARDIAQRLGCHPLLGRAADLSRAELPFATITPEGSLGVELDIFGEIGQDVAGPDSTFATVLAELTLSGKNPATCPVAGRPGAARATADPPSR
jgi:hypothetical protein